MFKKYKPLIFIVIIVAFIFSVKVQLDNNNLGGADEMLGASFPDAKWDVTNVFHGYQTKSDPSKVAKGANPQGQNTTSNNGDRISIRDLGYEMFPTETSSTTEERISSMHTFRLRDGENIMMRAHGTRMDYYEEGNDTWTTLLTGLSDNAEFDFADYNINTDLQSYVYFGNAVDDFSRWTGNHSTLNGGLALNDSYVTVDDIAGFVLIDTGVVVPGTLIICGTEIAYNDASTTLNRFSLTASSTIACDDGIGIAEAVETYSANPKGNIYMVDNNRLFIAGIASTSQAAYFSEYGDATNFVDAALILSTTATAPGIFNLGEGGGAIIGMAKDEGAIYFFKKSAIRRATLDDTIYTLSDLKPTDGKSQTIGAVNNKGIFTSGNQIYLATPDNQILSLGRVESFDYPQTVSISDIISPTVDNFKFDDYAGIVFRDKAYFSLKSSSDVSANNTVMVWDLKNKNWDSPIIGWAISDFTVYDDGTSEELYMGDAISPNVYKVIPEALDGEFDIISSWRSRQEDFGIPHAQKQITNLYLEGYIAQNTTLTVNLLLNEDGYEQTFSHDISGTDEDLIYDSTSFNTIGLSPFGTERFGSNENLSGKKKFRVYFSEFRPNPFYNMQIEFTSDGPSMDWEILNYAVKWRPYTVEEDRSLFVPFR